MDSKQFKEKIPRLALSEVNQNPGSCYNHIDADCLIPTFSIEQINEKPKENLEDQIDRLNTILESMLCGINNQSISFVNLSKIQEDSFDFLHSKTDTESKIQNSLLANDSLEILLQFTTQLQMKLQDLESKMNVFKKITDPLEFKNHIEGTLAKFLDHSNQVIQDPSLSYDIEQALNCFKATHEHSFMPFETFARVDKQVLNESLLNESSIFIKQPIKTDVECRLQELESSVDLYNSCLRSLGTQLSNLTQTQVQYSGLCPEIELPRFTSDVLSLISHILCKEKEIELQYKALPPINLNDHLTVACTYDEVLQINTRLQEIIHELSETGCDNEYTIKVGLLSIGISVYFDENSKSKYYNSNLMNNLLNNFCQNIDKRSQSLAKAQTPSLESYTDRQKTHINSSTFIEELNEQILELTRKVVNLQEINEMQEDMFKNIETAGEKRVEELETLLEEKMFEIEVKNKQIEAYKKGMSNAEIGNFINYAEKIKELREKENVIKSEYEKMELEKQKIVKQTIELLCNKKMKEGIKDYKKRQDVEGSEKRRYNSNRRDGRFKRDLSVERSRNDIRSESNNWDIKRSGSAKGLRCKIRKDMEWGCEEDDDDDDEGERSDKSKIFLRVNRKYKDPDSCECSTIYKTQKDIDSIDISNILEKSEIIENPDKSYYRSKSPDKSYYRSKSPKPVVPCQKTDQSTETDTTETPLQQKTTFEAECQTEDQNLEGTGDLIQLTQELNENYSKLEDSCCSENNEIIINNIKRIKKRINEIHTKQALIFTEKSIDYAERKLDIIEKELKKGSRFQTSPNLPNLTFQETLKRNERLEKCLSDLHILISNAENWDLNEEKAKFIRDKILYQQQKAKFDKKRSLLKQKICQVNDRQKKIAEIEEELNEKKIYLTVQGKKQDCYRQAIEEEWARIDSKRQDVLKCQKMIDDEWKNLAEASESFETLKKNEDLQGFSYRANCSQLMEKLSEIEENALKVEVQQTKLENARKRLDEEKTRLAEEWKKLEISKRISRDIERRRY
ncbi:hypothetical protein SteCoe_31578 [Stentor coeruleus]|uniref:Uncharacterized protein n=1 Tax=Stentor coeruleus TaxID=5963 RepID=A0A1R2B0Z7_9CILI|nr:hypothetical protein SteCoe_31578 [Stentor coeruleus]